MSTPDPEVVATLPDGMCVIRVDDDDGDSVWLIEPNRDDATDHPTLYVCAPMALLTIEQADELHVALGRWLRVAKEWRR